jgi:uncharacterized protein (TIGR03435 family)
MARTVLSDRFRIVTHEEHKAVAVYALTAPAPKLGKADDATRSSCREVGVRPQSTGRMSAALKVYACQNMDMDYFARSLKVLGPSYINRPVIDETGLSGGWDFTLSFSASIPLETGNNKSGDASPADPNGAVSLSEALKRQLGLKLQLQKHTMPVIVVDRAEQSPVNN